MYLGRHSIHIRALEYFRVFISRVVSIWRDLSTGLPRDGSLATTTLAFKTRIEANWDIAAQMVKGCHDKIEVLSSDLQVDQVFQESTQLSFAT